MNEAKIASIFLIGTLIGGAGTYWAVTGPIKKKYEGILDDEIAQVKDYYRIIHTKDEYPTPEDRLKEKAEEAEVQEKYLTKVSAYEIEQERTSGKSEVEERSIFDYNQKSKTEGGTVSNDSVRVITYEEFDGENDDYTKTTLTYYQGDDTVADEMDDIIADVEATLGPDGISSFGKLDPNSPDTAYIRNDRLRADYEVLLEEKSYREVVVGE